MSSLLYDVKNGVAYLTMNRPEVRNALSSEMRIEIHKRLEQVDGDDQVRCVVLRGAGKHFLAGGDISMFLEHVEQTSDIRRAHFTNRIQYLHPIMYLMRRIRKPILASVQGAAAGAGVSLALSCDLVMASEEAFFTLSYTGIGCSPDSSASFQLPRVVGTKKAMEMALLAERYSASEVADMGMINWVVPGDELEKRTCKLAERIAAGPTQAYANTKRLIWQSLGNSLETQLQQEAESFGDCTATDDWVEGINAFNEKRRPVFRGK